MSGGVGYTQFVDIPPIAGQPVIQGYLDALDLFLEED